MATIDLDTLHPDFTTTKSDRDRSRVLYTGGKFKTEDTNGTTYLLKGEHETDTEYELRLKRAILDNYVEKIVQARQAMLFRKEHKRELPPQLELYETDVDLEGTTAEVFFQETAHEAQIDGIAWVVVDMPQAPEGGFASKAEQVEARHRPYFKRLMGANVIDWNEAPDGTLDYAVIRESYLKERTEAGKTAETAKRWRIWYRDRWEVWEQRNNDTAATSPNPYVLMEEGKNPLEVVPLVPFFGYKATNYSGYPVTTSVIDHIILILNKTSELDRAEKRKTEPIPYFISPEKPVRIDETKGLWINSEGAQGQITVGILEPSAEGLNHNLESIAAIRAAIFSITLAQAKKDSAQVQSAEGQREDRRTFTSSLQSASRTYEDSEERCWRLWAAWAGVEWGEGEVEYNREFDEQELDAQMIQTLNGLADSNRLTDETLLDMLQRAGLLPKTIDIEEELRKLQKQKTDSVNAMREQLQGQRALEPNPASGVAA